MRRIRCPRMSRALPAPTFWWISTASGDNNQFPGSESAVGKEAASPPPEEKTEAPAEEKPPDKVEEGSSPAADGDKKEQNQPPPPPIKDYTYSCIYTYTYAYIIDLKSLDEQLERHLNRAWTMEKNKKKLTQNDFVLLFVNLHAPAAAAVQVEV
nr:serine/threonine-protein kinase STY13-like [Ipomoea batatas]